MTYGVLNPSLVMGETYNIAFRIGDLYPARKPYLSVYVSTCANERVQKRDAYHLHTMMVDVSTRTVSDDSQRDDVWLQEDTSRVYETMDGAWMFNWTVPDTLALFPGREYCLIFDMTKYDPAFSKPIIKGDARVLRYRDLKQIKPYKWTRHWHPYTFYHKLVVSPIFRIEAPPTVFTAEYFSQIFGGRDLGRFLGGDMFVFRFFDVMYNNEVGRWNGDLFYAQVDQKAAYVAEWLGELIDVTPERWRIGFFEQRNRRPYMDTVFADMEDRRRAQIRAVGLLYHPRGRESLKQIAKGLLKVAEAYEVHLLPHQGWHDHSDGITSGLNRLWNEYVGGFASARRELSMWIEELKKLVGNQLPTRERMDQISRMLPGDSRKQSQLPISGQTVYRPEYIEEKITGVMSRLVKYEIRLVMWKMGKILLQRKNNWQRRSEFFLGFSNYDLARTVVTCGVVRIYGTKFMTMAEHFVLGKGHRGDAASRFPTLTNREPDETDEHDDVENEVTQARRRVGSTIIDPIDRAELLGRALT
jgi:hypothetical protein